MIAIRFACGHRAEVPDRQEARPACGVCGQTRIAGSAPSRPPTFRGACRGPYAEAAAVEPQRERLVSQRLVLKPTDKE